MTATDRNRNWYEVAVQRLCVLFVLIAAFAGVCRGEPKVDDPPLALPSKTLAALDELTGAFDSLELAREAADSLASNRKPEHLDKDKWARLSDRMEAAAAALARTPESANFDDAQAAVNPGDFDSPTKHDHAVEDLREKIGTVSDAFRRGRDEEDRLERFIHSAFKADNVVGDLIRTGRRLGQTPEVQQYFAWRWEDLEGRIRPAIRSAIREMIRRQHSIGVERDKVGIMSSKLKNGQGIWERSPVEGFWSVPVPDTTVQYAVNAPGDREATFQDVSFGFRLSFTGKLMGGRMDLEAQAGDCARPL